MKFIILALTLIIGTASLNAMNNNNNNNVDEHNPNAKAEHFKCGDESPNLVPFFNTLTINKKQSRSPRAKLKGIEKKKRTTAASRKRLLHKSCVVRKLDFGNL